jgi:colanic acid/amylovoran biosynthesis protein
MKILIRGAGFENKGAEAMLRVAQRELSKRVPDTVFYACVLPEQISFAYDTGIVPLFYSPSGRMQLLRKVPYAAKIPEHILSGKNPDFARAIKTHTKAAYEINAIESVDAVIDVSGFSYSDSWGVGSFKYAWPWLEYCQVKNKPYIFLPQAWGPFEKYDVAIWAKKLCDAKALIVSRDDESSMHLAAIQGKEPYAVRQCPDIAFCFQGAPRAAGTAMLKKLGVTGERPVVGIVPNMRVYERTAGTGAGNQYVKLLIALADHCINNLRVDLLLAPNEIKVPGHKGPDDRFLCSIVAAHIQKPDHCFTLREYCSSEIVKATLGSIDFLVASRFHSLVFALSQGVPAIALGWSHKYQELLKAFGMENFVVDHVRLDRSEVVSLLETAWQQRDSSSARISQTVSQLKAQVEELFDQVGAIIRGEVS